MATLKEAVESGRPWRHRSWQEWAGPGVIPGNGIMLGEAISSDFEIEPEPEPEKPREWTLGQEKNGLWIVIGRPPDFDLPAGQHILVVHDTDACDRLHPKREIAVAVSLIWAALNGESPELWNPKAREFLRECVE